MSSYSHSPPLAVGVDVGGTKLAVGIINADGDVILKRKWPVEKTSPGASFHQIERSILEVCSIAALRPEHLLGIGVAVPGISDSGTGLVWAPNLWGNEQIPLCDELRSRIDSNVSIDSDRTAYVLGEQWRGAARGLSDVAFMAVGTGIGLGIMMGGRSYGGAHGIAGAIGWFAVDPRKKAIYQQLGCLEAEAAGPAVARKASERLAGGQTSQLHLQVGTSFAELSTETVVAAAREGDHLALEVLEEVTNYLAMGVANVISVLNPQMVVLGGGLMQASDLLFAPLCRHVLEWGQPLAARKTRIELSQLGEDAGLLGAARLVFLRQQDP